MKRRSTAASWACIRLPTIRCFGGGGAPVRGLDCALRRSGADLTPYRMSAQSSIAASPRRRRSFHECRDPPPSSACRARPARARLCRRGPCPHAWRPPRQGLVPDQLRSQGAAGVRARRGDAPFVLVFGRRAGVPRRAQGRSRLRHRHLGHRLDPDVEPARRPGCVAEGRRVGAGGARGRAPHRRQDRARARLHRRRRRLLPGFRQAHGARAPGRARQRLRGAGAALSRRRRGADLLRALHRRDADPGRPDLRRLPQGRGHPRGPVRQVPGPPGRRALPHPQLRRAADRRQGARRRTPLCRPRARRAARAAHALAHLHARGGLAGVGRDQPALARGGQGRQRARRGLPRVRLHGVCVPAARARCRRAPRHRRGDEGARHQPALRRAVRHRGDAGALRVRARRLAGGRGVAAARQQLSVRRVDHLFRAQRRRGAQRRPRRGAPGCRATADAAGGAGDGQQHLLGDRGRGAATGGDGLDRAQAKARATRRCDSCAPRPTSRIATRSTS